MGKKSGGSSGGFRFGFGSPGERNISPAPEVAPEPQAEVAPESAPVVPPLAHEPSPAMPATTADNKAAVAGESVIAGGPSAPAGGTHDLAPSEEVPPANAQPAKPAAAVPAWVNRVAERQAEAAVEYLVAPGTWLARQLPKDARKSLRVTVRGLERRGHFVARLIARGLVYEVTPENLARHRAQLAEHEARTARKGG